MKDSLIGHKFSTSVLHGLPSSLQLEKKLLKPTLFTIVNTVILNHRLELLQLCCGASPGAVYLSNSQLLFFHLALCRSSNLLLPSNFISGSLSHPAEMQA